MRTANPTLNANTFVQFQDTAVRGETMTIQGTVNTTGGPGHGRMDCESGLRMFTSPFHYCRDGGS